MDLLALRDHVYHRVQRVQADGTSPELPTTVTAQQALQAWKRRLRSVGGKVTALTPPGGALEWASPLSGAAPRDNDR